MNVCDCNNRKLGNVGKPNCIPEFGIARKAIYMYLIDSDGNFNNIDPSVELTPAVIEAHINDPDPTKRWYLSPEFKNFNSERDDSETEEFDDGTILVTRKGARNDTYLFVEESTTFLDKLEENVCGDIGVFYISDNESVMGICRGTDGFVYPIALQGVDNNWMMKLDSASEKVSAKYQWRRTEQDRNIRFIFSSEFSGTFASIQGLIDVMGELNSVPAPAAGSFSLTLRLCYGSKGNEILHTGVVLGDITSLTNLTSGVAMTVDSVTETSDGVYDIAYTGATAANDILQIVIDKTKFDYTLVENVEIVYP